MGRCDRVSEAVATLGASALPQRANRGYFTIVGAPGSGKSAILAKYVTENPSVVYYNAQIEGKNQADEFIAATGYPYNPSNF